MLTRIFVKGLDRVGQAFTYLKNKFPILSDAIVKEGVISGP